MLAGPATLNAILCGADIKVIAALNEIIPYKLVAAKTITRKLLCSAART